MPDSARVTMITRPLAADSPPMKAASTSQGLPAVTPRPRVKYCGLLTTPSLRPAQRIGGTARLISSRNSGSAQLALTSARGLRFSVKVMWNMCGMVIAAAKNTSSRVRQGPSCSGVCRVASAVWFCSSHCSRPAGPSNTPYRAYRPMPVIAHSLTSDSKAMAITRPSWRSRVAMRREPNRMVNRVISAQKPSATRPWIAWPVIRSTLSATDWICRASSGSTATRLNSAVRVPAQVLRKRKANRSASEDSW